MANYTKSTNFTSKDTLVTGNPLKIVKGAEFDVEFNAIAVAITSKADLNSPALTGIPTAPTAASGTSNGQLATTAFVQAALQLMYPVGSVYTNATSSTNPNSLLGFGTWEAFGAGRVLIGVDSSGTPDPLFDTVGETGGSKDAVIVTHTHTATVLDDGHTHSYLRPVTSATMSIGAANTQLSTTSETTSTAFTGIEVTNSTVGESGTNKNLQPYITVYMWKRTA